METFVAGTTAALLTLFDLDRTFYVPAKARRKFALYSWWISFILVNGLLAILLYLILQNVDGLREMNSWLKAVVIGVGYLALVRLKFATFSFQGKEVPFGLEAFYDAGKGYVFKRINAIAIEARRDETIELAASQTLEKLAQDATFNIEADTLLSPEEKRSRKVWLVKVLKDTETGEVDKKMILANFIRSGQMMGS